MSFRRIDYLLWARQHMGRLRWDLARSNVKSPTPEELALPALSQDLTIHEEQGVEALRATLGKRYGLGSERIFVTSGATQGLYMACAAALDRGDEILLESPNYEPLYRLPLQLGAEVKMIDRRFDAGWQIDLEELERRAGRGTRAILMTNLHNPSGVATNPEKLMTIGQIARSCGARVIVSEVYLDNAFQPGHRPAASYGDHMVSVGSLSKVYGLGALRIGWVAASEELIARMAVVADYLAGGVPTPSQTLALAALQHADRLAARCREIVQRNLKIVSEWLRKRPDLRWVEPEGGTVAMLKLPAGIDALTLSTVLRERYGTLVVPGDFFWIRGFIRISLGTDEDVLRTGLKNIGLALDQLRSFKR